ncbi:MAG: amidohydrolase family protein [Acidobacteria bacterium]|nr:amidohydrolase family protein [Acidobacteriota bacterium]
MKRSSARLPFVRSLAFVILLFSVACVTSTGASRAQSADTIVHHARIYTVNSQQPWAEALAIQGDKIVAVGGEADVDKLRTPKTRMIDAGGRLVLPGFVDCHIHFMDGSLSLGRVNLDGAKDVADIQRRLREYAAKHPGKDWILGRGWDYAMFGAVALPDKKYLDEVFPNRPAYLEGYDSHTYWAYKISDTTVTTTIVGGRVVYQSNAK